MNLEWAKKRKIIYGLISIIFIILVSIYIFRDSIFVTATCVDNKQNGYESGVDCGGTCSLKCTQDVIPLAVSWSRSVKTGPSTYDLVALVSNKNIDNAPRKVGYTFKVYDASGNEIGEIPGVTTVPIDGDFPILAQNVNLTVAPYGVSAVLEANVPHYTVLEKPTMPTLRVTGTRYEPGSISRVYTTLINTKRTTFTNLPVRVLLYDADGNAYAGGQTIIPSLGKEEAKDLVFTWKGGFSFSPTKIRVFPILDPFLGSL